MNLRQLLGPQSLTGRLLFDDPESPLPSRELALLRAGRRAMATLFEVVLPFHGDRERGIAAAGNTLDLIDELEDQMTVYRDHSEVSRLNAEAWQRPVRVEDRLFDLFDRCARLTRETGGAFDIATGALIKTWGFYKRQGRIPTPTERAEAMARTGTRHVALDREARTVRFRREGLEINLGAVGKGYALDRARQRLEVKWGIGAALLHGGKSSVLAIGAPPGEAGWRVALRHPDTDELIGMFRLCDRALGTSAANYQYFEYNGRKLGHLLDPRRGWPANGPALVSVVAPTGELADSISTALFVLGEDGARKFLRSHPEIGAVLLPKSSSDGATPGNVEPVVINLSSDEFRRPSQHPVGPAHLT